MEFYALFLLVILTSVFSTFPATSEGEIHTPSLWKLAVYWPNSWCRTNSVHCIQNLPQNQFLIRTLYIVDEKERPLYCTSKPAMDRSQLNKVMDILQVYSPSHTPLVHCIPSNTKRRNGTTFPNTLDKLMDLLPVYWPDLNGDNYGNWEFLWQRHASCFGVDPHTYFFNAIGMKRIAEQYIDRKFGFAFAGEQFYGALFVSLLYPGHIYPATRISGAFSHWYGLMADLRCNEDDAGVNQLLEFHICSEAFGTTNELKSCTNPPKRDGCKEYTRYT